MADTLGIRPRPLVPPPDRARPPVPPNLSPDMTDFLQALLDEMDAMEARLAALEAKSEP